MKKLVPVYPWPIHPKVQDALPQSDYIYVEAMSGGPSPVLAIRKAPPWVCDVVVVLEPEMLAAGVAVVVQDGIKMVTVRDTISELFGQDELLEGVGPVQTAAQAKVQFR